MPEKMTKKERRELGIPSRGAQRRQALRDQRAKEQTEAAKAYRKAVYTNGLSKQCNEALKTQGCFGFVTKDGTLHFSAEDMEAPGVQDELDRLTRIRDAVRANPPAEDTKGKVSLTS